jgi:hypothetical protein
MSAYSQANPLPARFSRWLLGCAVRHWPEETRAWGTALAAEVDETTGTWQTLLWSWGGIMLFARSVISNVVAWIKLPVGSSLPGGAGGPVDPAGLPRRSRLLAAVVLIAAAAVFLSPQGQEVITTVRASWQGAWEQSPSDRRAVEKLSARAEKENDAETLAFAALSTEDPQRAIALADRAVSLNPQLVWIYGARGATYKRSPFAQEERLERFRNSDPDNAVPVILAADLVAAQSGAIFPEHLSPAQVEAMLANNPKWMALMQRALTLPRYNAYDPQKFQLTSEVWGRNKYLSPALINRGLWSGTNQAGDLWTFSRIRVREAESAAAAGNLKEAERLLGEVDSFGQRIANDENSTVWERFTGLQLELSANNELTKLYTEAARTADAQRASARVQQSEERQRELAEHLGAGLVSESSFRRTGILVLSFGCLAIMAGVSALAGILLLELWPARNMNTAWRSILRRVAGYGPAASLVFSGASLLSFLPVARAFAAYRDSAAALSRQEGFRQALAGMNLFDSYIWWRADAILWFWCSAIVVLAGFAILIVARGIYRARLSPSTI